MTKPTPAIGHIPFPGSKTMREIMDEELYRQRPAQSEKLSGYREVEPRNHKFIPRQSVWGVER